MDFPFGQAVHRDRRKQVQDPYNTGKTVPGDWDDPDTINLTGAWIASATSIAQSDGARSSVLVSMTLYCDPAADVQVGDRIRTDDATYYVNELPVSPINPWTGWQPVRKVPLDATLG